MGPPSSVGVLLAASFCGLGGVLGAVFGAMARSARARSLLSFIHVSPIHSLLLRRSPPSLHSAARLLPAAMLPGSSWAWVREVGPLYRRGLCAIFRKVAALPPRRAHACSTAHWTCSRSCVARCAASSSFFYRRHHSARRQCPELQWRGVSRALVCAAVAVKTCAWQTCGKLGPPTLVVKHIFFCE